jgi:hypothetical protein
MKLIYLFLSLIIISTDTNLTTTLDEVNALLSDIETDKELILQSIEYDEDKPFQVRLNRTTEKIKDGKQKVENYDLNLALINRKNVEIKSSKNKMSIKMVTDGGKFIQKIEDEEPKGPVNTLEILCQDIDAARSLKELLEKAIDLAREEWESSINLPGTITELKSWMSGYIADVSDGDKSHLQTMSNHPDFEDYLILNIRPAGHEDNMTYTFSLGDIEEKSMKVNPTGEVVKLDMKTTSNKKYIVADHAEKGRSFDNNLSLLFSDATKAIEFTKGVEMAIGIANTIKDNRVESYESCSMCKEGLSEAISTYGDEKWKTQMDASCSPELTYMKVEKDEVESYRFNWADMDSRSIKMDYNTSELKLTVGVADKAKYVTKLVNGEIKGYQNDIELLFNDLESFRKAKAQVSDAIDNCELDLSSASINWIDELFSSASPINEMNQTISMEDGDECSLIFTSSKEDSDKSFTYEYNLYDLDAKRVKMNISGSKLQLELVTKNNEKIITRTNQDGKLEYVNKMVMDFDNITNLRTAGMTLEDLIKGCIE